MTEDNSDLVIRLEDVRLEIKKLQEMEADLESAILASVPEGKVTNANGETMAVVEQPMRFSPDVALAVLPPVLHPLITESKVSAALVKQLLPKLGDRVVTYDMLQAPTGKKRIRIVDEE